MTNKTAHAGRWIQLNWSDEPGVWKNIAPVYGDGVKQLADLRKDAEQPEAQPRPGVKATFRIGGEPFDE